MIKLNGDQPRALMKDICCLHSGQLVETVLQYYLSPKIARHTAAANGSSPLPELRYGIRWFRHSLCGLGLHLAHWFRVCFPAEGAVTSQTLNQWTFSGVSLAEAANELKSPMSHLRIQAVEVPLDRWYRGDILAWTSMNQRPFLFTCNVCLIISSYNSYFNYERCLNFESLDDQWASGTWTRVLAPDTFCIKTQPSMFCSSWVSPE